MNGRQPEAIVIELCLQLAAHDEMGFVRVYRPAFIQEVGASLDGIQKNQPLSEDMNVDDLACPEHIRRVQRKPEVNWTHRTSWTNR